LEQIHVALVYRGTAENAQKFISAQEKLLTELAAKKDDEKENTNKPAQPEIPENPSQSEITEDDNSGENNSGIEKVIIDPENNSEDNSENSSATEVTSDAESV